MEPMPSAAPDYTGTISPDRNSIFISTPAKINLFLKVTGKRPDGYHDIYSWFQALDLCDHLEIEKTDQAAIEIITDSTIIPTGPENLVYQAALAVQKEADYSGGFRVRLWKNIPVGAGLGGGSSDAAAFIKGANRLLELGWSREKMAGTGLELGSDVPFFFSRGQAEVSGRGEIVKTIELPVDYQVVLVTPPFEIRAAEAYRKLRLDLTAPFSSITFKRCRQARELFYFVSGLGNDLEQALRDFYPILNVIGEKLEKSGADIVRLSGSGPTMFALFKDTTLNEETLRHTIRGERWGVNVACPVVLPA